jgi:NADPH:quinone reductase-like Zn-dependent oxidoreductase
VVRVTYAGVNPLDYKLVDSLTPQSSYPFVLGIDFAGVLQHAPSAERELRAGDRVFGIARTHGSYAEYTAVPADGKAEALGRIPEPIADDQAAALPIAGITALGAVDFTRVAAGQSLVVMGATGGVGGYARRDAEILKADGRLVSTLYAADIPWFAERDITAENIASVENPLASRGGLTELARFMAAGAISARITTTESLANAGAILDRLRHGGVHGKAVIRM